jgi:hypothetical protein
MKQTPSFGIAAMLPMPSSLEMLESAVDRTISRRRVALVLEAMV